MSLTDPLPSCSTRRPPEDRCRPREARNPRPRDLRRVLGRVKTGAVWMFFFGGF